MLTQSIYQRFNLSLPFVFCLLCVICGLTARAQEAAQNGQIQYSKTVAVSADNSYRIGAGDMLNVVVAKNPLLSQDGVRVGNNGTIRLPMLEESIQAACLTEVELTEVVAEKYKKYLLNPQVYVAVREFNSNQVALLGAIGTPGRFQLQRPTRLLDLLAFANGPSGNAGRNVQIIRSSRAARCEGNVFVNANQDEDQQELITLTLAATMRGDDNSNPFVQAGDIIRITEAEQAFIIGNVRSATTVTLKEPMTLSKAIAMAGGVVPGAVIEKIKISRQAPGSLTKTEFTVNLKDINKRKQEDVLLQANDVVDVPGESGARKVLKDIFRTIIPAVTRVPIGIPIP